jgi:RES domain-containing protein
MHGARWTPKKGFPTVYLCDSVETALQEFLARGRRMNIPDYKLLPMLMAWVEVDIRNLLDLTEPNVSAIVNGFLASEKIHWRAIQDRREAISQAIGRAVNEICFSGLIAPSQAVPGKKTIVIFPQKINSAEQMSAPVLKTFA